MPAFYSHYRFGVYSYREIPGKELKTAIRNHPHAFALGCQGPDLFFYDIGNYIDKRHNYTDRLHNEKISSFFWHLIRSAITYRDADIEKYHIMLAYSAGFLAHYCLDRSVHPYVYSIVGTEKGKYFIGKHFQLESDIDLLLLRRMENKKVSDYNAVKIISLSKPERATIAKNLAYSINKSLGDVNLSKKRCEMIICEMKAVLVLLNDKSCIKGKIWELLEKKIFGYKFCSPLFYNDMASDNDDPCNEKHLSWLNPFNKESCSKSFFDLFMAAKDEYIFIIDRLDDFLEGKLDLKQFLEFVGNISYKTGIKVQ